MKWRGRKQSSNIEDRRGQGGSRPFGRTRPGIRMPAGTRMRRSSGGGLSGILMLVVLFFVLRACGIDPMQVLNDGTLMTQGPSTTTQAPNGLPTRSARSNDEMTQFVGVVLAETEDSWSRIFSANGRDYDPPTMVLFSDGTQSGCGFASSASGPFYCPADRKVYIDLSFYRTLSERFGASGDFAQAYVIAHEVGHHIQNLVGVLPRFNQMRQRLSQSEANAMSVRVELQADCFAGIWAHDTAQKDLLERGDIEEAMNAARQIGDDMIQKRTQGYVVPESFSHGTSEQRMTWFMRGFETGALDACDTFEGRL